MTMFNDDIFTEIQSRFPTYTVSFIDNNDDTFEICLDGYPSGINIVYKDRNVEGYEEYILSILPQLKTIESRLDCLGGNRKEVDDFLGV